MLNTKDTNNKTEESLILRQIYNYIVEFFPPIFFQKSLGEILKVHDEKRGLIYRLDDQITLEVAACNASLNAMPLNDYSFVKNGSLDEANAIILKFSNLNRAYSFLHLVIKIFDDKINISLVNLDSSWISFNIDSLSKNIILDEVFCIDNSGEMRANSEQYANFLNSLKKSDEYKRLWMTYGNLNIAEAFMTRQLFKDAFNYSSKFWHDFYLRIGFLYDYENNCYYNSLGAVIDFTNDSDIDTYLENNPDKASLIGTPNMLIICDITSCEFPGFIMRKVILCPEYKQILEKQKSFQFKTHAKYEK